MHIGETLTEARQQAGLTVAEVSQQTRIRQTIIRGIEGGDYSACGGDFYARGHIRSIAKAVGADPEPLIHEYDITHQAPALPAPATLDLDTPVRMPPIGMLPLRMPGSRQARPARALLLVMAMVLLVVLIVVLAFLA